MHAAQCGARGQCLPPTYAARLCCRFRDVVDPLYSGGAVPSHLLQQRHDEPRMLVPPSVRPSPQLLPTPSSAHAAGAAVHAPMTVSAAASAAPHAAAHARDDDAEALHRLTLALRGGRPTSSPRTDHANDALDSGSLIAPASACSLADDAVASGAGGGTMGAAVVTSSSQRTAAATATGDVKPHGSSGPPCLSPGELYSERPLSLQHQIQELEFHASGGGATSSRLRGAGDGSEREGGDDSEDGPAMPAAHLAPLRIRTLATRSFAPSAATTSTTAAFEAAATAHKLTAAAVAEHSPPVSDKGTGAAAVAISGPAGPCAEEACTGALGQCRSQGSGTGDATAPAQRCLSNSTLCCSTSGGGTQDSGNSLTSSKKSGDAWTRPRTRPDAGPGSMWLDAGVVRAGVDADRDIDASLSVRRHRRGEGSSGLVDVRTLSPQPQNPLRDAFGAAAAPLVLPGMLHSNNSSVASSPVPVLGDIHAPYASAGAAGGRSTVSLAAAGALPAATPRRLAPTMPAVSSHTHTATDSSPTTTPTSPAPAVSVSTPGLRRLLWPTDVAVNADSASTEVRGGAATPASVAGSRLRRSAAWAPSYHGDDREEVACGMEGVRSGSDACDTAIAPARVQRASAAGKSAAAHTPVATGRCALAVDGVLRTLLRSASRTLSPTYSSTGNALHTTSCAPTPKLLPPPTVDSCPFSTVGTRTPRSVARFLSPPVSAAAAALGSIASPPGYAARPRHDDASFAILDTGGAGRTAAVAEAPRDVLERAPTTASAAAVVVDTGRPDTPGHHADEAHGTPASDQSSVPQGRAERGPV